MAERDERIRREPPSERGRETAPERATGKLRVPAEPIPQRPDEQPIGNGGTNGPPAFPEHN